MNILKRLAEKLYRWGRGKRIKIFYDKEVIKHITSLNHNIYSEESIEEYYSGKLYKSLLILLAVVVISVIVTFKGLLDKDIDDEGYIERTTYIEGSKNVEIIVENEDGRQSYNVEVNPRRLSKSELDRLYEDFADDLYNKILGKNLNTEEVSENLSLVSAIEGYPFEIRWSSERPEVVSSNGSVYVGEIPENVTITAHVSYEEYTWEQNIELTVKPKAPSEDEARYADMQSFLEKSENEDRDNDTWEVPKAYEGLPIRITQKAENNGVIILLVGLAVSVAIYFLSDRDLSDNVRKNRERMKKEYGDIVQKLTLYIGAGMTVRGAFGKIAADYEERRIEENEMLPAYEEIVHMCREIKKGVSEVSAYERFGLRTGVQEYIRLSALLTQNLKKGSSELIFRLREEADRAMEERLQNSRRLGEEANTKLLLPMMMMLLVVMVMIMLPAFSSTSL